MPFFNELVNLELKWHKCVASSEIKNHSIPEKPNYIEQQSPTISTTPIPLYLDDALSNVYNDQLKNGIQLSVDIYPNILNCMNHYPCCDPVPARASKGIIIYTESDVIYLPEHQGI